MHNASLIDSAVEPGDTVTYQWFVQPENGPESLDLSTVAYAYGSDVDATANTNAGLFGAVIIGNKVNILLSEVLIAQAKQDQGNRVYSYWFTMLARFASTWPTYMAH